MLKVQLRHLINWLRLPKIGFVLGFALPFMVRRALSGGVFGRPRGLSAERGSVSEFAFVAADDADDFAEHFGVAFDGDGLVAGVGGLEPEFPVAAGELFDGGLAIDEGDDDLARLGVVLAADDDEVVLANSRLDHRVAVDFEGKDFLAREFLGEIECAFDILLGKQRTAGGNASENGHGRELSAQDIGPIVRDEAARFAGKSPEMAFGFQGAEMVAGRSRRTITEGVTNFADGRWTTALADAVENVREQLLLWRSQWFLHGDSDTTRMCGVASGKGFFG